MLAQLGSTTFEIAPFNATGTGHDAGADFAEKAVMGRRPPLEFVGEAPESYTIQAKLFPAKFDGLSSLDGLHKQRQAGEGWYQDEGARQRLFAERPLERRLRSRS